VPTRKALRLPFYDYSAAGLYFVTVCTRERRRILGQVRVDQVFLSEAGSIVERQLGQLPERLSGIALDSFVVMPNHVHVLVQLDERARQASPLRHAVGGFKSGSAREINVAYGTPGAPVWQRGYYGHVIRNEGDLNVPVSTSRITRSAGR
jgi:putative transposase